MQVVAGFLLAVIAVFTPWVRRGGLHIECVGGGECAEVAGIAGLLEESNRINLVIVHGMGAGLTTDYTSFTEKIAVEHLGLIHISSSDETIPQNPEGTAPARLFIRIYANASRTKEIHVYELHWWHLIQNSKSRLLADERYYKGHRAYFNRKLKAGLVNDRIADPIIYLGPLKPAIHDAVKYTLCQVAGGRYGGDRQCAGVSPERLKELPPTVVVTENLGSEIVAASLDELAGNIPCDAYDAAAALSARTPVVFMLANQLPLLRLARTNVHADHEHEDPLASDCPMTEPLKRQVVAVSDPSDLLSYPIPNSISQNNTEFINIIRPLGHRLVLGTLVDPLGAHTNGKEDPRIVRMIACGYPSKCQPVNKPARRMSKREHRTRIRTALVAQ